MKSRREEERVGWVMDQEKDGWADEQESGRMIDRPGVECVCTWILKNLENSSAIFHQLTDKMKFFK